MKNAKIYLILLLNIFIYNNVKSQVWSAVDAGFNYPAYGMAEFNGELFVGGQFTPQGSTQTRGVAVWSGDTAWKQPSYGIYGTVNVLAEYNGQLFAGGSFFYCDFSQVCASLAVWNGNYWSPISNGTDGIVNAMQVYNGELYIAGSFNNAAGLPAKKIVRYDGTNFSQVYGGMIANQYAAISDLEVYNNELYAVGEFSLAGGVPAQNIAKFDGNTWSAVGAGLSGGTNPYGSSLAIFNGELYVAGKFTTAGSVPANYLAKWDGSNWSSTGTVFNQQIYCLGVYDGDLIAGGAFTYINSAYKPHIARSSNGTTWLDMFGGLDGPPFDFITHNSELYVCGSFTVANGIPVNNIARWVTHVSVKENTANVVSTELFPNPFAETTTLKLDRNLNNATIEIYNAEGKKVNEINNISGNRVEIKRNELSAGIYFLRLKENGLAIGKSKFVVTD